MNGQLRCTVNRGCQDLEFNHVFTWSLGEAGLAAANTVKIWNVKSFIQHLRIRDILGKNADISGTSTWYFDTSELSTAQLSLETVARRRQSERPGLSLTKLRPEVETATADCR
jgi:hypothetical protein